VELIHSKYQKLIATLLFIPFWKNYKGILQTEQTIFYVKNTDS